MKGMVSPVTIADVIPTVFMKAGTVFIHSASVSTSNLNERNNIRKIS